MHIYIHIGTYIHTYMHTYIHTYIHTRHTYLHTYIQKQGHVAIAAPLFLMVHQQAFVDFRQP